MKKKADFGQTGQGVEPSDEERKRGVAMNGIGCARCSTAQTQGSMSEVT